MTQVFCPSPVAAGAQGRPLIDLQGSEINSPPEIFIPHERRQSFLSAFSLSLCCYFSLANSGKAELVCFKCKDNIFFLLGLFFCWIVLALRCLEKRAISRLSEAAQLFIYVGWKEKSLSCILFWLELRLSGCWSPGQRLQWAGNRYTNPPSVLTGASQLRRRLDTFHNLLSSQFEEEGKSDPSAVCFLSKTLFCAFAFFLRSIFMTHSQITKSIQHRDYTVGRSSGPAIWKSYMHISTWLDK